MAAVAAESSGMTSEECGEGGIVCGITCGGTESPANNHTSLPLTSGVTNAELRQLIFKTVIDEASSEFIIIRFRRFDDAALHHVY